MDSSSPSSRGFVSRYGLWILPGLLFVACAVYGIWFAAQAPAESSRLNERQAFLDQSAQDAKLVAEAQASMASALNATKIAHIAYVDFADAVEQEQKLPSADSIGAALQQIHDAQNQLSSSSGSLERERSNTAAVTAYARRLASDLETYPPMLDPLAKTLLLAQQGDQAGAFAQVAAQKPLLDEWPAALKNSQTQLDSFSQLVALDPQTQVTAEKLLASDQEQFNRQLYLAVAAAVYMAVFAVLLARKVVSERRGAAGAHGKGGQRRRRR